MSAPPVRRRDLDPSLGIELLILIASQAAIAFSSDPNYIPAWLLSLECLAFSGLRAAMPIVRERPRLMPVFVLVQVAVLIAIVLSTANGAVIALSIAFILRNAELLSPGRALFASIGGVAVALAAMVSNAIVRGANQATTVDMAMALVMAIGITGALASFAASERRSSQALRAAHDELRRQAEFAVEAAMQHERSRIAANLHDAIGHTLTALNVQLQSAVRLREQRPVEADAFVASALALGLGALDDVRRTVGALRDDPLEHDSLDRVLERIAARHANDRGPRIETAVQSWTEAATTATVVARIAEEAVVNAIKHARARNVRIGLRALATGRAELEVRDDGCGFEPGEQVSGHGLQIMRERARGAGMDIQLRSAPGDGTSITLHWFPVPAAS